MEGGWKMNTYNLYPVTTYDRMNPDCVLIPV